MTPTLYNLLMRPSKEGAHLRTTPTRAPGYQPHDMRGSNLRARTPCRSIFQDCPKNKPVLSMQDKTDPPSFTLPCLPRNEPREREGRERESERARERESERARERERERRKESERLRDRDMDRDRELFIKSHRSPAHRICLSVCHRERRESLPYRGNPSRPA